MQQPVIHIFNTGVKNNLSNESEKNTGEPKLITILFRGIFIKHGRKREQKGKNRTITVY